MLIAEGFDSPIPTITVFSSGRVLAEKVKIKQKNEIKMI